MNNMTPIDWAIRPFKNYATFTGRALASHPTLLLLDEPAARRAPNSGGSPCS